uniref:Late endosomal/lysosomal adaptor and MAPK and MTOR activator 1 n=1 Tax=Panagrellus redivivus TaxID=6233 RepID=A0A7E4UW81_PANRE
MSLRQLLCCCGEDTSDDERNPMITNEPEDLGAREIRTHGVIAGYPDESIDQPPAPSAVKTREQIEEELLNKILDRTQQQIIDVNNYDVYVEVNVSERRSQYDQVIEQHDASKLIKTLSRRPSARFNAPRKRGHGLDGRPAATVHHRRRHSGPSAVEPGVCHGGQSRLRH